MDSDHSESEFYYPDEVEKFSDKEISVRNGKKTNRRLTLRSIKRAQKFKEPRFLQSSVRRPSAENVLNFKPLRPRKYSDIDSKRLREHRFAGESSQRCQ